MRQPLRSAAVLLSACLCGSAATAQGLELDRQVDAAAAAGRPASRSFAGIVINGRTNPLRRSDRRVAILSAALPLDTGPGAAQRGDGQPLTPWLALTLDPQKATGETRRMMERSLAPPAGPDPDAGSAAGAP